MTTSYMPTRTARDHSLDALRAAMMLLGLVLHSAASYTVSPLREAWPYQDAQTSASFDLLLFVIHIFRMPVFFVIAGFFAALLYERDGATGFIHNRVRRVLLPLVVFWALVMPAVGLGFFFALRQTGSDLAVMSLPRRSILREPILGHLWFLYNLLFYYGAAVVIVALAARLPARVRTRASAMAAHLTTGPMGVGVLAGITMLSILPMAEPGIGVSASLIPQLDVLAAYGAFFAAGWILHGHRDALAALAVRRWWTMAAGVISSSLYVLVFAARPFDDSRVWHVTAAAIGALSTWLLVLAIIGVFVRHLQTPRPVIRYFSDAAYWIYLVHLPLTIWIPGLLARSPMPAVVKFAIVLAITTLVTTISYEYLVRSTRVGVLLNGRRYPRGLPKIADPQAQQAIR